MPLLLFELTWKAIYLVASPCLYGLHIRSMQQALLMGVSLRPLGSPTFCLRPVSCSMASAGSALSARRNTHTTESSPRTMGAVGNPFSAPTVSSAYALDTAGQLRCSAGLSSYSGRNGTNSRAPHRLRRAAKSSRNARHPLAAGRANPSRASRAKPEAAGGPAAGLHLPRPHGAAGARQERWGEEDRVGRCGKSDRRRRAYQPGRRPQRCPAYAQGAGKGERPDRWGRSQSQGAPGKTGDQRKRNRRTRRCGAARLTHSRVGHLF